MISIVSDTPELQAAEEKVRFLIRELSHRSRNLIAVIQAIAGQTARSTSSLPEFQQNFSRRLQGIAASHDLLVKGGWSGVSLADLIAKQLVPFCDKGQLELDGPDVVLSPEVVQSIGLALHELVTNAAKFGALSEPAGKLHVFWKIETDEGQGYITLNWQEKGGPRVVPRTESGFGIFVVGQMLESGLNGRVFFDFAPEGLIWTLRFPEKHLVHP